MSTTRLTPRIAVWVASFALLAGCAGGETPNATNGGDSSGEDAGMTKVGSPDGQAGAGSRPALRVEVGLTPAGPVYALEAPVKLNAQVFDRAGESVSDASVNWSVSPSDAASQFSSDPPRYRLQQEGEITFEACASFDDSDHEYCNERSVIVDNNPPDIELNKPEIGVMLDGSNTDVIVVEGKVTDSHGTPRVYVDGTRRELDDEGRFQAEVEPHFGVNRIEVTANDGLHEEPSRAIREVIWAPHYGSLQVDADDKTIGAAFGKGLALDLGQHFFDDGEAPKSETMNGETASITEDLADILLLLLENISLTDQIPNPAIDTQNARLGVDSVQLQDPDVSVDITDRGLDFYLQIPGLKVVTSGSLTVEQQTLDLNGSVTGRATVGAQLDMGREQGGAFKADVQSLDVSVDELKPRFSSDRANAVFQLAESTLRSELESRLSDALREELLGTLPSLLTDALNSIQGSLSEQTVTFGTDLIGERTLTLNGSINTFEAQFRRSIRAILGLQFNTSGEDARPNTSKIPMTAQQPDTLPLFEQSRIQIGVRMAALNGLLGSLWKSGLLDLDLAQVESSEIPDAGTLSGTLPPVLRPARGGESYDFVLEVGQIVVETELLDKKDKYGLSLQVGVNINLEDNELSLEIQSEPQLETWLIRSSKDDPVLSSDQLRTIVMNQVWPRIQKAISGGISFKLPVPQLDRLSDLSPTLSNLSVTLPQTRPIAVRDGYIIFESTLQGRLPLGSN